MGTLKTSSILSNKIKTTYREKKYKRKIGKTPKSWLSATVVSPFPSTPLCSVSD